MRNTFLVSAAVAIFLGIEVNTASIRDEQPRCDVFQDVQLSWFECRNFSNALFSEDPLGFAENVCRQKDTDMECVREIFASCANIDVIMDAIGATFSYCDGNALDFVFSTYLEYAVTDIDQACEQTIMKSNQPCVQLAFEPFLNGTLTTTNGLQEVYRMMTTIVTCLGPFMEIPSVPECDGESGLKAVLDFLVKMTLHNVAGSATYERFRTLLLQKYSDNWRG